MFVEISGFLFLFIIVVLNLATARYGYEIFSDSNSNAKLQKINEDPKKFKKGVLLVVTEHIAIVLLAITLFIAFSPYNILLGVVWGISRAVEGLVQINNKKNYLSLTSIAVQYSSSTGTDKEKLSNQALVILKTKNSTFIVAQILFSIGTLAYSIVFAFYEVVPVIIGWFGIIASIIYGLGNGVYRVRPDSKALWNLGGLLIFVFELVLGGWLLFSSLVVL
ncbi:MAG: DUF4386 domain-containing protein [Candidatus Thorarchaeota archaeon]|nr:DUF4386 domain-containing protein [Candidatus Thorarchaeota archaeon]